MPKATIFHPVEFWGAFRLTGTGNWDNLLPQQTFYSPSVGCRHVRPVRRLGVNTPKTTGQVDKKYPRLCMKIGGISFNLFPQVAGGFAFLPYAATLCGTQRTENRRFKIAFRLLPLDGVGSAVPSFQLHPVFGIDTERVPPNDAMSRFVGFGDKSWDNLKNFFQTQGFEFLFLSQSARRVAFGGSMAPKTPVLKLNRPFACKPPAAIASELTRVACAPFAKPQVAGLRHS